MNIQKFTQKSIEAVNDCEKLAYDYGNQEIDQEHFLYSLMTIEDSLIASLIEKMNIDPSDITAVTFTNKAAKEMKERLEKHFNVKSTARKINIPGMIT